MADPVLALLAKLEDASPEARAMAAKQLGELGDPRAFGPLSRAARCRRWRSRPWRGLRAWLQTRQLELGLWSRDEMRRWTAAAKLAATGDQRSWFALERAAKARRINVRDPIEEALSKLSRLGEAEKAARAAAIEALCQLGDRRATPVLLRLLASRRNQHLAESIAKGLGSLGDPRAERGLLGVLDDKQPLVRRAARQALEQLGRPADPFQIHLAELRSPDYYGCGRRDAIRALAKAGDPRAVPYLWPLLGHSDRETASAAAKALGELGDRRSVEPLIGALRRDACVYEAAQALAKLADPRAIGPLIGALDGPAPGAAEKALAVFGAQAIGPLEWAVEHGSAMTQLYAAKVLRQVRHGS